MITKLYRFIKKSTSLKTVDEAREKAELFSMIYLVTAFIGLFSGIQYTILRGNMSKDESLAEDGDKTEAVHN